VTALLSAAPWACSPPPPASRPAVPASAPATSAPTVATLPAHARLRLGVADVGHHNLSGITFAPGGELLTWSDASVQVWDWAEGRVIDHYDKPRVLAASPLGRWLLTAGDRVEVRDAISGDVERSFAIDYMYNSAVSEDGRMTAVVRDREVAVYSAGKKTPRGYGPHGDRVMSLAFDPAGRLLATGCDDDEIRVFDVASGDLRWKYDVGRDVYRLQFSRDGTRILAVTDNEVHVWETDSGERVALVGGDDYDIYLGGAALSPDGSQLAVSESVGQGALWLFDLKPLRTRWRVSDVATDDMQFSPDGRVLVARAEYGMDLQILGVEDGKPLARRRGRRGSATALAASGGRAFVADSTGTVTAYALTDGAELFRLKGHDREVTSLALTPDGRELLSGSRDETAARWDLASRRVTQRMALGFEPVRVGGDATGMWAAPEKGEPVAGGSIRHDAASTATSGAANATNRSVALIDHEGVVLGQPGDWSKRRTVRIDQPDRIAFAPAIHRLAEADGSTIRVWDTASGRLVFAIDHEQAEPSALAISPAGSKIAFDVGAAIWVVGSDGHGKTILVGHSNASVQSLAFAGEDELLSGGSDGAVLTWSTAELDAWSAAPTSTTAPIDKSPSPACPPRADAHGDPLPRCAAQRFGAWRFVLGESIRRLAFSPDDRFLAGGGDGVLVVWKLPSGEVHRELPVRGEVASLAFHPDNGRLWSRAGSRLSSWSLTGDLDLRSVEVGESDYNAMALSPSGAFVVTGDEGGLVQVFRSEDLDLVTQFAIPASQVGRIGFANEDELVIKSPRLEVTRWDWRRGRAVGSIRGELWGLALSPKGVVFGADDGALWRGSPSAMRRTRVEMTDSDVMGLARDGSLIAVAADAEELDDGRVVAPHVDWYDGSTERKLGRLSLPEQTDEIAVSSNGSLVAVATWQRVLLVDTASKSFASVSEAHTSWVEGVGYDSRGRVLTVDRNTGVKLWDATSGKRVGGWQDDGLTEGRVTPDGRLFVGNSSSDLNEHVVVKPIAGGRAFRHQTGWNYAEPLAISPDGRRAAASLPLRGRIDVLRLPSLKKERSITLPGEELDSLVLTNDGRILTILNEAVAIFDEHGEPLEAPAFDPAMSSYAAISPDGKLLAFAGEGGVELRDATTLAVLVTVLNARVYGHLVVSSRGWLAYVDAADVGHVWHVGSGRELARLHQRRGIDSLASSPDGKQLLSGSWSGSALSWDIETLLRP
jgi:WD40 repeat protein